MGLSRRSAIALLLLFCCALTAAAAYVAETHHEDRSELDEDFTELWNRESEQHPSSTEQEGPAVDDEYPCNRQKEAVDPGEPLFLTPLIEAGNATVARNRSKLSLGGVTSYSGYFTVNKTCNANLFFWFVPAKVAPDSAPVLVWLQGGPGSSSMFGLFEEHGPFSVNPNNKTSLKERKHAWTKTHSVLYVDSPVGTGYSFTDADSCYATNQGDVARDLYSLIVQFFAVFPDLLKNDFYVTGESYGGKYVPAITFKIHEENSRENTQKINLKGMAIGNGLSDPISMLQYGDLLYQLGLIDDNGRTEFHDRENRTRTFITQKNYMAAFNEFDALLNGDNTKYPTLYTNLTGFKNYFNYLFPVDPFWGHGDFESYLQLPKTRKTIHVGNKTRHEGKEAHDHLLEDFAKSVKPWIEQILENRYRVMFYNGQLDIIVAYPLTVNFLSTLEWKGAEDYSKAPRRIWRVGGQIAGYAKTVGNFTEVLVRDAGHMVPADQPFWSFDMISRFTAGKPF